MTDHLEAERVRITPDPDGLLRLRLSPGEADRISELVDDLSSAHETQLEERLTEFALHAHELPTRLRALLTGFRLCAENPAAGVLLSALPIDEAALGPTPVDAAPGAVSAESVRASTLLLLIASLLGEPFSFATQQRGKLMLDVYPVPGHEDTQLGSSSQTELQWHTEDAFHPFRADWILLLGLRNPNGASTMLAPLESLKLDEDVRSLLFTERFVILPDESHSAAFNDATTGRGGGEHVSVAFDKIRDMTEQPKRISVLSGDRRHPFVRIDPAFMSDRLDDPEAEHALRQISAEIDRNMQDVVVNTGELLVIDNKRAVHGRRPFTARYDGTDRWLRRINVSADLRAAAAHRHGPQSRTIA